MRIDEESAEDLALEVAKSPEMVTPDMPDMPDVPDAPEEDPEIPEPKIEEKPVVK